MNKMKYFYIYFLVIIKYLLFRFICDIWSLLITMSFTNFKIPLFYLGSFYKRYCGDFFNSEKIIYENNSVYLHNTIAMNRTVVIPAML